MFQAGPLFHIYNVFDVHCAPCVDCMRIYDFIYDFLLQCLLLKLKVKGKSALIFKYGFNA